MLFGKKKKKNTELDEAFSRVAEQIRNIDEKDNPKKIEHYILDSCEHIVAVTKEVEAQKAELRSVNDYLFDVKKIVNMPPEFRTQLIELVDNVGKFTKRKKAFTSSEKRLSDDEFILLQEREDVVITDIRRLEDNEKYRDKVDSDVKFLESEKSRWEIEKDYLFALMKKLRMVTMGVTVAVVVALFLTIVSVSSNDTSIRLPLIVFMFFGVLCAFVIFLFMGRKRRDYKRALKKLNQNISLLNVERMRYANVTKAIKYEQSVYDVRSSGELSYLWEQYILTVKDREAYRKNNLDLAYYVEKLYKLFKRLDLRFEKRWLEQIDNMLDLEYMNDLHERILERKSSIDSQITVKNTLIRTERDEIDRMMRDHDFYVPEVMEIIYSVDRLCSIGGNPGFEKEKSA